MIRLRSALGALSLAIASTAAQAQGIPATQPSLITIGREAVKMGRNAEHEKFEAGWPAAYEAAKSPYNYIALTSLTGQNEAWYVSTYASNAAIGESMKAEASNPTLSAELARLSKGDAEYISGLTTIQASARSDLSYGAFPNIALQRYWEISIYRVRPGHESQFENAAKAYISSSKRNAPNASFRVYEVIAGIPGPTYLIFSSVAAYADFDRDMAAGAKVMGSMNAEESAAMQKFMTEGAINYESQRFALSAPMSFVNKATKDQDPAFWMPKKAAAKKAP